MPTDRQLSLRAKLALGGAVGALALVLLQTALSVWMLRTSMTQTISDSQSALADRLRDDLDERLRLRIRALELLSGGVAQAVDVGDNAAIAEYTQSRPVTASLFDALVVADAAGTFRFSSGSSQAASALSMADRGYFQQVMRSGAPVVSSPVAAKRSGRPIVAIAVPVRDGLGRVTGVIAGLLYLDQDNVLTGMGRIQVGQQGHVLVSTTGPQPVHVVAPPPARPIEPVPLDANPYARQALQGGFEGTVEADAAPGAPSLISYRRLASAPWVLSIVYPTQDAYAVLRAREREVVVGGGGMALAAGIGVWLFAGTLFKPLRRLREAMERDADTGRAHAVDERAGSSDLAALVRCYNKLASHRSAVEAQLKDSEQRLRAIADNLPALVSYVDRDETYRFANAYFRTLFEIEPDAMIGRTVKDCIGAARHAEIAVQIQAALRGEPQQFERDHAGPDGASSILVSYVPDRADDGSVRGFYALTLDITQRRKAELAQAQSQARLKTVTDNMPALIGHIDCNETYLFVNAHYETTFGVRAADWVGRTVREMLGDLAYAGVRKQLAGALAGQHQRFERCQQVPGAHGDFEDKHVIVEYVPERAPDGSIAGLFVLVLDITARKQAELALQRSEERVRAITDNLPALVAYIDKDVRYGFANSKYRDWLGVEPEEMLGKHVRDAVDADFFESIRPNAEAALAGHHVRWEREARRHGAPVHYQTDFLPDTDANGQVRGFYALTIDVTARHLAELASARTEQRLMDLTNSIPAMVGYFDMDEACQYANDTALKLLGLSRDEVPGIPMRTAFGDPGYQQHLPAVREALAGRRACFEGKTTLGDRQSHFQAHLIPDREEGGAPRGFYLMTFDITALKEAQMRQHRSEQQLRAIADNLPVLISYVDKEERFQFLNATYGAWTGVDPQRVVGRTVSEVVGKDFYAARTDEIRRTLAGERLGFEDDTEANGTRRNLHTTFIPDVQEDGQVAGFFGLSTDITARKQIERELASLARIDSLTGLPNRHQFNEVLPQALLRSQRSGQALALVFLDIDHFKRINDGLGHAAGDAVLKEFGRRLQGCVRGTDTIVRLAGDEFVVILEALHDRDEPSKLAQKILDTVNQPFNLEGHSLHVTTSLGVVFHTAGNLDGDALLAQADAALYKAKAAGRNAYHLATA